MKDQDLSRLAADADRCVRCGLCIPLCPTWQTSHDEGRSPRGRIVAMAQLAAGGQPQPAAQLRDSCLGCGLCEKACPSDVPYMRMIGPAKRAAGISGRPLARMLAALAGRSGGDSTLAMLLAAGRIAARMPGPFKRLATLLPRPNRGRRRDHIVKAAAEGPPVVLFRGCLGGSLDHAAQSAAEQLLAACGYKIARTQQQACCGSLPEHAGLIDKARNAAARNRKNFAQSDMMIATTASGCAASLAAQNPAARIADACQLVLERIDHLPAPTRSARQRIILHIPCSSRANSSAARLLQKIPAAEIIETQPGQCCGAGGLTWINHPDQAGQLGARAADMIIAGRDAATVIASPNHPCARHLERALARRGVEALIRHPLEIFADSFRPEAGPARLP